MEIVLGFLIALAIGVTGVGAGIITAPVLIIFMHVPPAHAVGTALAFGVAVKLLVVPMQLFRKQVNFGVLGYMLAGGLPGVIIGSLILGKLNTPARQGILYAALGYRRDGRRESLPPVAPPGERTDSRLVTLAAADHFSDWRGSRFLIGGRRRDRLPGIARSHIADRRPSGRHGSLLRPLRLDGWKRIPAQRR
jgi:hypothetical protein